MRTFIFAFFIAILLFSCTPPTTMGGRPESGTVKFAFGGTEAGRETVVPPSDDVDAIVVTIEDTAGNVMYDTFKLTLYDMGNGNYISESVQLDAGSYKLTKFLVVDADNNILYAAPLAGSPKANLVSRPLPLDFSVQDSQTTSLSVQVVETQGATPADFGYVTFSLEVVTDDGNLLVNGDFSNGKSGWGIWPTDNSTVENGELNVAVTDPGQYLWDTGLGQTGFTIENGETYIVSFEARSDSISNIRTLVQEFQGDWTSYSGSRDFYLSSAMTEYSYIFTMTEPTDTAADFEIFVGGQGQGTIYIDNVVIKKYVPEQEIDYPVVTPNVDRSNIITYEIVPGSYNGGSWDGGQCFKGITGRLDQIKELGVNCIWLTPVFEGQGMGYWTYDYYMVNHNLGTVNDLKELVYQAHSRGILVILDLVINHTWKEHPFFRDVMNHKGSSPYADYYIWDGEPGNSNYGYYFDWTYVPNLNLSNSAVREYLYDVAAYWVNKLDIDGYRVDVAWGLEDRYPGFSSELRSRLDTLKPGIFLLAEGNVNEARFFDNGYDSAYDWDLRGWGYEDLNGFEKLFAGTMTPQELHNILTRTLPGAGMPLRFAENHDHFRAASLWGAQGSILAHTIVMTSRGIAHVFGGGEVGFAPPTTELWTENWPVVWDFNAPIYAYFKKIIAVRRQYLKSDLTQYWIDNDSNNIYASLSVSGTNKLLTVANCSTGNISVTLDLTNPHLGTINGLTDLLGNRQVPYDGNGSLVLTLGGYETAILLVQ